MKERERYTVASLELHLFFLRIMKEHAMFLAAGFTPANQNFTREALQFRTLFENLLLQAVRLGSGIIRPDFLAACEAVTEHTPAAEEQMQHFTNIQINQGITRLELQLTSCENPVITVERSQQVKYLNQQVLLLLKKLIRFKETILEHVCACHMFTANYPTLIEHITNEAKQFQCELMRLENEKADSGQEPDQTFWNRIMMEHALFLRGLLDPCENKLIVTANSFAETFAGFLDDAASDGSSRKPDCSAKKTVLAETVRLRDFKEAATAGIEKCEIRSVTFALLADHITREANHYIRLLQ